MILKGELDASHYRGQRVTHCTKGFLFGFYFMFVFMGGGYFLCFCLAVHETVLDLKLSVMLFSVFSLIWFLYSNFSENVYKVNRDWKILNDEGSISLSLFRIRILSGRQAII